MAQRRAALRSKKRKADRASRRNPAKGTGPEVYVGYDAEWVLRGKTRNRILSHQYYLVYGDKHLGRIFYSTGPAPSQRPHLTECLTRLIVEAIALGIIPDFPSRVCLCGFFMRADLAAAGDLSKFKNQIDSAAGRATTVRGDARLDADFEFCRLDKASKKVMRARRLVTRSGRVHYEFRLRFIDAAALMPPGYRLEKAADLIGLKKVTIPSGYSIERMDVFLRDCKQQYEEYALTDAEIAVRYVLRVRDFFRIKMGLTKLPPTVSAAAVDYFCKGLAERKEDIDEIFSVTRTTTEVWNDATGKVRTVKQRVPTQMRALHEDFIKRCYHGGNNQAFYCGPTDSGKWLDIDIVGAYTNGLSGIRPHDFDGARVTKNVQDFLGDGMGFAYVGFSFPDGTRYPCLPVDAGSRGLYFPLTGESFCTAPELEVAAGMGARLDIRHGVVIPWKEGRDSIFRPFVASIRKMRQKDYPDDESFENQLAKLVGNGLYGKIAQAIHPRRAFNARHGASDVVPPSKVSHAAMAAHATGFVRAVVAELLASIPAHRTVISVTTDGFLTNATMDEINLTGPVASRFEALCQDDPTCNADRRPMLKCKGEAVQIIGMRTRGQLTAIRACGKKAILAKSCIAPDPTWKKENYNEHMVKLYEERKPRQRTMTRPFVSMRQQWVKGADVVRLIRNSRMNLEFDFKRRPINPRVVKVGNDA